MSRLRRPRADAHTGAETRDAAHQAGAQNDGALRVKGIAGFFQPREKEPHSKTPAAQVTTQRRTRDRVKVYPTSVKMNFSYFADQHFFLSQSKHYDCIVLLCHICFSFHSLLNQLELTLTLFGASMISP
jgi:hypothetical protein